MKDSYHRVRVVSADFRDLGGIARVYHNCWLATYTAPQYGITRAELADRLDKRITMRITALEIRHFRRQPHMGTMLIAKRVKQVVGICCAKQHADYILLTSLYVDPSTQRAGVGSALWRKMRTFLDCTQDIVVWVAEYNFRAIAFYRRLGFKPTGRHSFYRGLHLKSGNYIPTLQMILRARS